MEGVSAVSAQSMFLRRTNLVAIGCACVEKCYNQLLDVNIVCHTDGGGGGGGEGGRGMPWDFPPPQHKFPPPPPPPQDFELFTMLKVVLTQTWGNYMHSTCKLP